MNHAIDLTVRNGLSADDDTAVHWLLLGFGVTGGQIVHVKRGEDSSQAAPSSFPDKDCTKIRLKLVTELLNIARPVHEDSSEEAILQRAQADAIWEAVNAVLDFATLGNDEDVGARGKRVKSGCSSLLC